MSTLLVLGRTWVSFTSILESGRFKLEKNLVSNVYVLSGPREKKSCKIETYMTIIAERLQTLGEAWPVSCYYYYDYCFTYFYISDTTLW